MPSYKFIYFGIRARGESTRILFKLGDQEFEDTRVSFEEWPALKPEMPMGQLPVLEIDGKKLCQSHAINRYLARKFGLAGKDDLEAARADMVADCIEEITPHVTPVMFAPNDEAKAEASKKFREETLVPNFTKMEKILEENNGGNGYFVGDALTWADVIVFTLGDLGGILAGQDVFDKFPKLKAHKDRVASNPKIATWIKERPETPF